MNKHLVRRRELLKRLGAGAFLATPVFRNVLAEAQTGFPQRLVIVQFPGGTWYHTGTVGASFDVKETDHSFTFDKNLAPLVPLRSDIAVLKQIGDVTRPGNEAGHVTSTLLTGDSRMFDEDNLVVPPGTNSIDQVIANEIGKTTRFGSVQMGMNTEGWEYTLTHNRISFANGARLVPVNDPMVVFSRLFGDALPMPSVPSSGGEVNPALERLYAQRRSILDVRKAELAAIRAVAGVAEHGKLDEHLTALRELEAGIPSLGSPSGGVAPMPGASCGAPSITSGTDMRVLTANMIELTFQAMNCDLTRVITLQWDAGDLSWIGTNLTHHGLQHEPSEHFNTIQTWYMSQAAALIQRFKSAAEGDGTLLSNSAILMLSEQSNGAHHTSIPILGFLAGQAGGKIKTGGDLVGSASSMNDLYIGMARAFGLNMDTFGEQKFVKAPLSLA